MRGAGGLLVRLLCTLALILAALPIQASGMAACALVVTEKAAECGMTCCAQAKPQPVDHSCCKAKDARVHRSASASAADCKCIAGSDPNVPTPAGKGFTGSQDQETAVAPIAFLFLVDESRCFQPGIVGVDSGPPISSEYAPDLGRAPPVGA